MTEKLFGIEQLREMANPIIHIPNFDNTGTIPVKVKRPSLMGMAQQGQIPNHLMGIASAMVAGGGKQIRMDEPDDEDKIKMAADTMDLYCMACLVEPTYEEFKDIMTDEQKLEIFEWAMGKVKNLNTFRDEKEDGADNNSGEALPEKAE